jgi:hypothetical protein
MSNITVPATAAPDPIDGLLEALLITFAVILTGYAFACYGIVQPNAKPGLGQIVSALLTLSRS